MASVPAPVAVTVNDRPRPEGARSFRVETLRGEYTLRYFAWVEASRRRVDELSGGRIGYLHVPNMMEPGLIMFSRYFYPQALKQAFIIDDRYNAGGFVGDPDIFDTWFTSSMTPQIGSHWGSDDARHERLFPADLRPQSHEIIRTWAFYTIAKAWLHEETIPWRHVAISGWVRS